MEKNLDFYFELLKFKNFIIMEPAFFIFIQLERMMEFIYKYKVKICRRIILGIEISNIPLENDVDVKIGFWDI